MQLHLVVVLREPDLDFSMMNIYTHHLPEKKKEKKCTFTKRQNFYKNNKTFISILMKKKPDNIKVTWKIEIKNEKKKIEVRHKYIEI